MVAIVLNRTVGREKLTLLDSGVLILIHKSILYKLGGCMHHMHIILNICFIENLQSRVNSRCNLKLHRPVLIWQQLTCCGESSGFHPEIWMMLFIIHKLRGCAFCIARAFQSTTTKSEHVPVKKFLPRHVSRVYLPFIQDNIPYNGINLHHAGTKI